MTKTSARSVTPVLGRLALAALLLSAGFGHLTSLRKEFQAQVPSWVPADPDLVVVSSGVMELVLGATVAMVPRRFRPLAGWVAAAFFVAVFPGNISQYLTRIDAFGLDTATRAPPGPPARPGRLGPVVRPAPSPGMPSTCTRAPCRFAALSSG